MGVNSITTSLLMVTAFLLVAPSFWQSVTVSVPISGRESANVSNAIAAGLLRDVIEESEDCTADQEFVSPYEGRPRCCSVCEPGQGMVRLCTDTNETECGSCKEGKEFSNVRSAREKCQPCTVCHNLDRRAKVRQVCTALSDTVCECIPGYFFNAATQTCVQCSKCPPGQGATGVCSHQNDTKCEPCGPGTYSDILAGTVACLTCRKCADGEEEAQKCSPKENTLCCAKPPCDIEVLRMEERNRSASRTLAGSSTAVEKRGPGDNWKTFVIYDMKDKDGKSNGSRNGNEDNGPNNKSHSVVSNNDLIPLYCAIMSLVILALVVYVVFKWWRRRTAASSNKALASPGGSLLGATSGPASVFSSGKRKAMGSEAEGRVGLIALNKEGSPCAMVGSGSSPSHGTKRVADLSAKRMRQIEAQLSQEKNGCGWSALAKALDYSAAEISHFESQADLHRQQPARFMLRDYCERPAATVAHLTKALQRCSRADVIPLLKEHNSRSLSTTVTTPNTDHRQCMEMGQV